MPYEILEKKIECLTTTQQQSVVDFVNFLLSQNEKTKNVGQKRQPGGLVGNFYMSPDFDETLECFKEYI